MKKKKFPPAAVAAVVVVCDALDPSNVLIMRHSAE